MCKVKSIKNNLLFGLIKTHIELTKKLETKYYAFNNRITSFSTELTKFYDRSMKKNHQRSNKWLRQNFKKLWKSLKTKHKFSTTTIYDYGNIFCYTLNCYFCILCFSFVNFVQSKVFKSNGMCFT